MKYLIKHKKNNVFLKYISFIKLNHYVCDCEDATLFENKRIATKRIEKFKHPENWELIGVRDKK